MPTLKIVNPANGRPVAALPADDLRSVKAKFAAARDAQPLWAGLSMKQRVATIARFRAALVAQAEELAAILTTEVGKPIAQSRNELKGVIARLDFFIAEAARTLRPRNVSGADPGAVREVIGRAPLGVVANISAWNYPYFVGANVFVPALAAGNAVLYKPSEFATLTGLAIARLLHASGVPDDVFIPLVGAGEVGAALVRQPVDGVFFTGSFATGQRIARAVGHRMIRLQLELGGKDPVYVREDVDVAAAAAGIADGAFYNTGQSCCSVERIYVQESILEPFLAAFVKEVKGFRLGDPQSDATYLGPLTRAPQLKVLERQVADARRKGARILTGGKRVKAKGNWFEPTVLAGVDHTMAVMREETFGPVIGIMAVAGDDEAVRLMNDTDYGLTAGVYTKNAARARAILSRVRAGSVYWNCCDRVSPRLPWSGVGHSGIGLTLSTEGIVAFTRPKAWHLRNP
ncbi:MAG TPA: aldehyde dehydrogenase family protein [Usitatibacteraceae bacterium]|nr:aldehyde dehydrogenase family protein [Usitatibacteraceae bacterium]